MKKKNLLKAILVEAVKRNLAEMPQIKRFYTLADDWENKLQNVRGYGTRFQDVALKMEALEDIFASIEKIISDIREKDNEKLVLICIDSIMGATTKIEMEADW